MVELFKKSAKNVSNYLKVLMYFRHKFCMKLTYYFICIFILFPIINVFAQSNNNIDELFEQLEEMEKEKKYHSGLRLLDEIIKKFPDNYDAKSRQCNFLLNAEYPLEDVQKCLDQISPQDPTNLLNMLTYGALYYHIGEYEKAKNQFSKILEIHPNNIRAQSLYYSISFLLEPDNEEYLKQLTELFESTNDLSTLSNLIKFLNDKGSFEQSKKFLDLAFEIDKNNPDLLTHMGVWYAKQSDFQNAERFFKKSLDEDENNLTTLNNLGLLYRELGDKFNDIKYYQLSIGYYESVLKLDEHNTFAKNGLDYSQQRIFEINRNDFYFKVGLMVVGVLATAIGIIITMHVQYNKDKITHKVTRDEKEKEKLQKRLITSRISIILFTGLLSIPMILIAVILIFGIPSTEGWDVANWAAMVVEVGIGITVAIIILSYELSKHDENKELQGEIANIISDVKKIEEKQDKKESEKSDVENRFYKLDLLPNIESLLMAIHFTLVAKKNFDKGLLEEKDFEKTIKGQYDEFGYWADRITNINSNTCVPPDIRNIVRMMLHQSIKPITFSGIAFVDDFLERTVFYYVDKIVDSDYIKNDSDANVKQYRLHILQNKQSIVDLRNEFRNESGS